MPSIVRFDGRPIDFGRLPPRLAAAIADSEERHRLFIEFTDNRAARRAEVLQFASAPQFSPTEHFMVYGESAARYLADGVAAGVGRSELVADCLGDWTESELSRAVALFHLGKLTGICLLGVSMRRLLPLARLVKRYKEERYRLRVAKPQVIELVTLVVSVDPRTDTAAKVRSMLDALLPKITTIAGRRVRLAG
jgi:hypothetical protein